MWILGVFYENVVRNFFDGRLRKCDRPLGNNCSFLNLNLKEFWSNVYLQRVSEWVLASRVFPKFSTGKNLVFDDLRPFALVEGENKGWHNIKPIP